MKVLNEKRLKIMERLRQTMKEANEWKTDIERYAYLWLDDQKEHMRQFLLYGQTYASSSKDDELEKSPPTLEQFQNQIDLFQSIYNEIDHWKPSFLFNNWLRVDARPIKRQLLNLVTKWINLFVHSSIEKKGSTNRLLPFRYKNYLIDHVTESLNELKAFIEHANEMLQRQVDANDLQGLIEMMNFLHQVRIRQEYTDDMSEPIKETIELLKSYAYDVPQSIYTMLDELPEQWVMIKKLAAQMKQHITPLQANQVAHIRNQIVEMDTKQQQLRDKFLREAPLKYQTHDPYAGKSILRRNSIQEKSGVELDHWASELSHFDHEVQQLTDLAKAFDINIPEYKT